MRTGIYPLDSTAINKESKLAEVFCIICESDKQGLNIENNELHRHCDSSQAEYLLK